MKKDTFYFSHDYNARLDDKIKQLIRKHGFLGYGCYWAIIEDLYNNANALRLDYDGIAFDLRITIEQAKSIINDFDLFIIDSEQFGSMSVERRLNERNEKSLKASLSASLRWQKNKDDANALQTQYDSNAIKEKKVKEKKVKEINNLVLFKNDILENVFIEFLEMRKKIKKPMTEKAKTIFKTKLEKLSNRDIELAVKIMEQSILNSWQDIYPLKENFNQKNNNGTESRKPTIESSIDFFNRGEIAKFTQE